MTLKLSRRAWIRTIIYSSLAIGGGVGYVGSKKLEVVRLDMPLRGLTKRLNGLKIGVMSDFHAGAFITKSDIRRAKDVTAFILRADEEHLEALSFHRHDNRLHLIEGTEGPVREY